MSERSASTRYWARRFWRLAEGPAGFPVDISYAVMCALEVYVEEVANLTTGEAVARSGGRGVGAHEKIAERAIHGCLLVGRCGAAILVEQNDAEDEKRFTVAHEAAHFILEVKRHQERAALRMGRDFVDVLHGLREATPDERIDAWLRDARADTLVHFMDRAPTGEYGCLRTLNAECLADDLAVEILAPRSELIRSLSALGSIGFYEALRAARHIAERRFGLPPAIAERYAQRTVWQLRGGASTAERFGF